MDGIRNGIGKIIKIYPGHNPPQPRDLSLGNPFIDPKSSAQQKTSAKISQPNITQPLGLEIFGKTGLNPEEVAGVYKAQQEYPARMKTAEKFELNS